jgi:lipid II:glycine glycyltransferase (peptidoglycan interpeptide bridge formation enzyme)
VAVRRLTERDRDYWDEQVQTVPNVHPLNAFDWGTVRAVDGWTPIHIIAERGGRFCGGIQLVAKRLPFLPYSILYGPKGPICAPGDRDVIVALDDEIRKIARERRAIFARIDPNIREDQAAEFEAIVTPLKYRHLEQRWSFWNSPRDVYRIDLDGTIDDLHKALDNETRRRIRRGPKEGLTIEVAQTEDELRTFYEIFKGFAVGKGFMARRYEYQQKLWECYISRGRGRLLLAKYQGHIIGGLLCIAFGKKCLNMHMGTPYEYRHLQPYYSYVWESIRWAKSEGCVWWSFRGVGTTPTQEEFKRKWHPKVVALVGYYDRPFKPLLYRLFYWAEFTLLPASWPLIVKTRKAAIGAMNAVTGRKART